MDVLYQQALLIYIGFVILATALIIIRRWIKPNGKPSDVWKKYPTYLALNICFLIVIWLPHTWHALTLLLTIIGCGASWELSRALDLSQPERIGLPLMAASLTIAGDWLGVASFAGIWLICLLTVVALSGFMIHREKLGKSVLGIAGCLGYLPWCLASFIWIRQTDINGLNALFFYGVIATSDAFAQVIGQLMGRRILAPQISPGKTLEGAAGGIILAGLLGAFTHSIVGWSYTNGAWMGVAVAIAGLIGDLTASSWKRALGIKDFSNIFGANGGFLDRFDSLIFAAPVFFLILVH